MSPGDCIVVGFGWGDPWHRGENDVRSAPAGDGSPHVGGPEKEGHHVQVSITLPPDCTAWRASLTLLRLLDSPALIRVNGSVWVLVARGDYQSSLLLIPEFDKVVFYFNL